MDSSMIFKPIDECIILESATDIARFCFIVQESISYLDLKLSTDSRISNFFDPFCCSCRTKLSTNFVNTEEKCRLFFAPRRKLLYTLNLDLPKGREGSFKDGALYSSYYRRYCRRQYMHCCRGPDMRCCRSPHIAEFSASDEFHVGKLSNFIRLALKTNKPKEKILKLIVKTPFSELDLLSNLDMSITSKFIDCFYPVITDAQLFSAFIKQFDIAKYMIVYKKPEIAEFLLYHARLHGNKSLDAEDCHDLINFCIFNNCFSVIGLILKYFSDSRPTDADYEFLFACTAGRWRSDLVKDMAAKKSITMRRLCLLIQVIWAYSGCRRGFQEAASEALRLIWSSVPDAFITYGELNDFRALISEERLRSDFDFYAKAVGELYEHHEPRSLKHLCRTVLRRTFEKNKIWIPDGISRMGLPKSLQAYLNLETTFKV